MADYGRCAAVACVLSLLPWLALLAWQWSVWSAPPPSPAPAEWVAIRRVEANFTARNVKCTYHTCVDIYKCKTVSEYRIGVYVYPLRRYRTTRGHELFGSRSTQYEELLRAVVRSPYYTTDPAKACIFIPDVDTLNPYAYSIEWLSYYLYQLPYWRGDGRNHLLFEVFPVRVALVKSGPTLLRLPLSRAMVASASFTERTYRSTFDVAFPTIPLRQAARGVADGSDGGYKSVLLTSAPPSVPRLLRRLQRSMGSKFLLLKFCRPKRPGHRCSSDSRVRVHRYPEVLASSKFCLIFYTHLSGSAALLDAIEHQCIPVILSNTNVFPFHEYIEWNRFIIKLNRVSDLRRLPRMLTKFSNQYVSFMQYQMRIIYARYFSSISAMVNATLSIINDRVFPYMAQSMQDANSRGGSLAPPIFYASPAGAESGFTAVLLTHNRVDALRRTIRRLAGLRHLRMVLVVWNDPLTQPPQPLLPDANFTTPIEVVRSRENRLTNRFLPYEQIRTDAVLSLDDDIDVLVPAEIQLAFSVWTDHPDRLVGFPARLHTRDAAGGLAYDAEWRGQLSMVLTGAAFYHKLYGALFHETLPPELINYVDAHFNCEDIAMNFLVANRTGKGPIKVGPRMKFRCPDCANRDLRASESGAAHLLMRSKCLTKFSEHFGGVPLQTVEFRADPVLYKTEFANSSANFEFAGLTGVL